MHIPMRAAVLKISNGIDGKKGKRVKHSERCREAKDVALIQIQRVHIHNHI